MPGRNALRVQKWASVLTEKVLVSVVFQLVAQLERNHNLLLDILGRQINKELALYDPSVVDENSGVSNLSRCQHRVTWAVLQTYLFNDLLGHSLNLFPLRHIALVVVDVV